MPTCRYFFYLTLHVFPGGPATGAPDAVDGHLNHEADPAAALSAPELAAPERAQQGRQNYLAPVHTKCAK